MAQGVLPFKYESEKKPENGVEWAEVCFVPKRTVALKISLVGNLSIFQKESDPN